MRVRKTTFEEDLRLKEEAFLKLTGEERLQMLTRINERSRKDIGKDKFKGSRVRVKRLE
ncbi:MAG: hypothetical protein JNM57_12105 [Cyclobacteriaceae bacterium]|nr:hypothetical protein [Cyclobacteriaceae bacterium]